MKHHPVGPKWTMRPRTPRKEGQHGPGPGEYHTQSFSSISDVVGSKEIKFPRGASYSMRGKWDLQKRGSEVGPGAYSHKSSTDLGNASKYSMRAKTAPSKASEGPGPATYKTEIYNGMGSSCVEKFSKAAAYSMRQKMGSSQNAASPGPGAYDTGKVAALGSLSPSLHKGFPKPPSYKLGSANRFNPPRPPTPGPDKYTPRDPTVVSTLYSMRARFDAEARSPTPGPGAYGKDSTQFM